MSGTDWLLLLHLLSAFLFAGGGVAAAALYLAAAGRRRPGEAALLLGRVRLLLAPIGVGVLGTLVFGLALAGHEHVGMGTAWISAALALWVASLASGAVGGRRDRRARVFAEELAAAGDEETDAVRARLLSPAALALHALDLAILAALLALMVWKPA